MGIVRPITDGMYAAADPALAEEIARRPVTAYPDIEPLDEGLEADITPAELAAEYTALVAYAARVATEEGEVSYSSSTYIIDPDGHARYVRDLADVEPRDWPRALLTAAIQARALRKATDRAEQQFAAMLWTARGHAEVQDDSAALT